MWRWCTSPPPHRNHRHPRRSLRGRCARPSGPLTRCRTVTPLLWRDFHPRPHRLSLPSMRILLPSPLRVQCHARSMRNPPTGEARGEPKCVGWEATQCKWSCAQTQEAPVTPALAATDTQTPVAGAIPAPDACITTGAAEPSAPASGSSAPGPAPASGDDLPAALAAVAAGPSDEARERRGASCAARCATGLEGYPGRPHVAGDLLPEELVVKWRGSEDDMRVVHEASGDKQMIQLLNTEFVSL